MKTYVVLLKLKGDKDSPFLAAREDVVWWRCKKASSAKVAVKRAIEGAEKQLTCPNEISALAVDIVSKSKAAAVVTAYKKALDNDIRHNCGHLCDIWCTIRRNAPEMI